MRITMKSVRLAAVFVATAALPLLAQSTSVSQMMQVRHWTGQSVAPVYEGFDINADGSYKMWFGYMNRNEEESLDIPVGPANGFEPGGDRGQPTHFVPRRHKDVFKVTVPKDFPKDGRLVWSLTSHGQTLRVAGTLNPVWQIDRIRATRGGNSERINSNTPPVVELQPATPSVAAPRGTTTLTVSATDDGLPIRRGQPAGMTVLWTKYRGPGDVTFSAAQAKLVNGKAATFSKDIAPVFQKACQTCHHPGTSAPMSLMTYDEVRPWARSIQQRVVNRDMPPWHLDKTVGIRRYKNDRSLRDDEIATIARWVEAGAPQGNPADMPKPLTFAPDSEWFIGEPDLKVTTPNDFTMYASGPDWWIDQFAEVQLDEDRWIKAMEIKPSNPKIVHHVVVYVIEPDAPEGTPETGVELHEYAVGKYGDIFGENTGRLLKKGTRLRYDMHYFAIGSEQHNKTTIAFRFYPKGVTPKYQVRSQNIRNIPNDDLEVPPNTVVRTDGYFRLPRAARIDAFQPHMHMRGRGLTVEAIDPATNRTQILSSVDHFDFNWHVNYVYADEAAPLLPAGTVLHLIGIHDNTPANRRNPDPAMWAGFGERSVDDMLQVWLNIVYLDQAEYQRLGEDRKARPAPRNSGAAIARER